MWLGFRQAKIIQSPHVARRNNMMCFINEYEFESVWIELEHSVPRNNALKACHSDICGPSGMHCTHLYLDPLVRVGIGTMPSSLLNKLFSVC
jgi:hypothetical protein